MSSDPSDEDRSGSLPSNRPPPSRLDERFHARSHAAIERTMREGGGLSIDDLIRQMDRRLESAYRRLSEQTAKGHGRP